MIRKLLLLCGALAIVGGGVTATAAAADVAPKVSCTYSSCNGKNPESAGCSSGAETVSVYQGDVELRYSSKCHAVWTRMTRGRTFDQSLGIESGYIDYYGHYHKQTAYNGNAGGNSSYLWSKMITIKRERFKYGWNPNGGGGPINKYAFWFNTKHPCPDSSC